MTELYHASPSISLPNRFDSIYLENDDIEEEEEKEEVEKEVEKEELMKGSNKSFSENGNENENENKIEIGDEDKMKENDDDEISFLEKINWCSIEKETIEKNKNEDNTNKLKKFGLSSNGLSNKKKKRMRSQSYFELENENKNKNSDNNLKKNENMMKILIHKEDESKIKNFVNVELGSEIGGQEGFLGADILPLNYDMIWSKGAVEKHKLLSRIICDWLDLLVVCNYL